MTASEINSLFYVLFGILIVTRVIATFVEKPFALGIRRFIDPTLFTTLGILGTFVGLTLAIGSIEPSSPPTSADNSTLMVQMFSALKVALHTTVWGLVLGVFVKFLDMVRREPDDLDARFRQVSATIVQSVLKATRVHDEAMKQAPALSPASETIYRAQYCSDEVLRLIGTPGRSEDVALSQAVTNLANAMNTLRTEIADESSYKKHRRALSEFVSEVICASNNHRTIGVSLERLEKALHDHAKAPLSGRS